MIVFARSVLTVLCFFGFGVGGFIIGVALFPIAALFGGKAAKVKLLRASWIFFEFVMRSLGLIRVERKGVNPNQRGRVIVANHPSYIDIVLLIGLIPDTLCVVKSEIKKNPIMSNIVKSTYLINDENNDTLKKEAKQALSDGYNVIIFPTGTRSVEGEALKLHSGAASVAMYANVPIVPIHITCDYKFLAKHQKIYDAGEKPVNYYLKINDTINIDDFKTPDINDTKLRRRINSVIKDRI